ncbi:MAG TPA: DUF58 domain-containing protein [Lacibacter sp.]|nr:DUF58 domain-containing protein [Lacibacter sp.]HMO88062.1 DUF58 domain-containing protein [Lacibacter sp.]HMP88044.1 DUF58 domain-containing protein [Lacibacter sp.]
MLTTQDILRKVRALEIKSKRLTNHLFTGEYHAAFKGQGMSYKEVREYQPGDDVRFIDWNVSARYAHPFTKVFEEERELTVFLLIDNSASIRTGTRTQRKKDLVTELAAVLAFSAVNNQDKVGALIFGNKVERLVVPKKGKQHTLFIVRELLTQEAIAPGTNYADAFRLFSNSQKRKSICFLVSDFFSPGFEDPLRAAARRHDVIGIQVYDPLDMQLPDAGLLQLQDAETGSLRLVDSSDPVVRQSYQQDFHRHNTYVREVFKKAGADLLHLRTGEDYVKVLQKFFINRSK